MKREIFIIVIFKCFRESKVNDFDSGVMHHYVVCFQVTMYDPVGVELLYSATITTTPLRICFRMQMA